MWFRPEGMAAYVDNELGTFNDKHGFNAVDNLSDPMDDNGHGTLVPASSVRKATTRLYCRYQLERSDNAAQISRRGGFGTTKDAIEAINYAVDRKKRV